MKTNKVAQILSSLTSNMASPDPGSGKQLDSLRRIISYNLRSDQQDIQAVSHMNLKYSPPEEKIAGFEKYAVSELSGDDKFLIRRVEGKDVVPAVGVTRGDIRIPVNPAEISGELRWNQKPGEKLGPFLSGEGRSIWFDLFYYEDKLTVRSQNGNIPHFLFSKARKTTWLQSLKASQTVKLTAGHVWIAGKLFTNKAGAGEYVGFNIKKGSFTLTNKRKWSGKYLDYEGDFSGSLTIQLVQPDIGTPAYSGCYAAQSISFKYPDEVTFDWKNGKLSDITAGDGKYSNSSNSCTFSNFKAPVVYENGLNHIFIPCQSDPDKWVTGFSQSRIFSASGEQDIKKSFWALPVARVSNPSTLTEPDNNGAWGLRLSAGITARWKGSDKNQSDAVLNEPLILLYPQALFLYSDKTSGGDASVKNINQKYLCWEISEENSSRIPVNVEYQNDFLLAYYCHATEGETLVAGCKGEIHPDRPVFADNTHIELENLAGWIMFKSQGSQVSISLHLTNPDALRNSARLIALENSLIVVSEPAGIILEGTLSATLPGWIDEGKITFLHGIFRWKPILPDPYVSNIRGGWDIRSWGRNLENATNIQSFESLLFAQVEWGQSGKPGVIFNGDLPLKLGVGIKPPENPKISSLPVNVDPRYREIVRSNKPNPEKLKEKQRLDSVFDQLEKRTTGWKLLDVSTNMDLIGVSVAPSLFYRRSNISSSQLSPGNIFTIKQMAVNTPLDLVHVFTVPQVQWEPVRTLPEDHDSALLGWFPEFLSSASDGGPTRLFGNSQELSPIIPDIVVSHIRESFNTGRPAVAMTTLSFGLKTIVSLQPLNTTSRNADSLNIVRPEFPQKLMKGGIQINLMAESGNPKFDSRSPGFEGFIAQTLNGYELFTGTELGLSVLGATLQSDASVETQFNKEFAPGGTNPYVPVTRFDLSGYGASNFSEWDNPGALASIGKVQFRIMVGRTAFEVVKFVSKIYPWGTTVTRSVTIERRSGGGVVRKDSGWQATQSALFDFRLPDTNSPGQFTPNPYQFKPGIFRGCYGIKNIRPASNDIIKFADPDNGNNVELAPVYFDAMVELEGMATENNFSRGILGFIQLSPKPKVNVEPWEPQLLSVEALKKLIEDQGAIGGPVDAALDIGESGFLMRATRFEVDLADNGTLSFAGIVRGQPVLPNNGAWSVVKMAAPGNTDDPQEAVSADVSRGTPLFIDNTWEPPSGDKMNISGQTGPYRFADPVDLFAPGPRYDYGFLQNTGSQAFLFRRPVIIPGSNELSSALKPAFADPFALLTSKGVFPPISNAIELPSSGFKLKIQSATGKLSLHPSVNYNNLRPPLIVAQNGGDLIAIEYDQSDLLIDLNEDNWNIEIRNFFIWTTVAGISKVSGTRFSLRAGTTKQAKLVNVISLLKPEIQDALNFLPGMGSPSEIGDIDLGMTNAKHEVKVHTFYKTPNLIPKPLGDDVKLKLKASVGVDSKMDTSKGIWEAYFGAKAGGELQGKVAILGGGAGGSGLKVFVVLGLELEAAFGTNVSETGSDVSLGFKSFSIIAYVGLGVSGKIGGFGAEAFLAVGVVFIYQDDTAKLGGLVRLQAEVDLKIVVINLSAELKGVIYKESGTTYCDATGQVAINVTIVFFSISGSYAYTTTEEL